MELLMANGHIGGIKPSLLQGFVHTPTNPISRIALQLKKKRILNKVEADKKGLGLVIQKQFEFEPSFDEYLKAMESVKSGREKTPVKDANFKENSTDKYVRRESEVEEGVDSTQEVAKASKSNLGMRRKDRVVKVSEEDADGEWELREGEVGGSVEEKNGRWTNGFSSQSNAVPRVTEDKIHRGSYRRTNAISDIDLTKRVLDEKSKHTNVEKNTPSLRGRQDRVVKGSGDMSTGWESREGDFDGSAKKTNRRWTNGFSSQSNAVERITEDKIHRGSYRKPNTISEVDLTNRVLDEKSKHMNVEKNVPSSNATRVGNTERATNFTGVSRWTREREQSCDTSIGSTTSQSSLDRTLNNWERTSKGGSKTELGETQVWKNKSITQRSDIDRRIHDYSFNERKSAYGVEKRGDPGYGRSNERLEVDRGYRHNEDAMSIKSRNFSKGAKLLEEEDEEGDMEMERAAFKSFEVFNDLRGQPRVLRMEMEERIQNLAKWLNGTDINLPEWLFSKMIHSARIRFSDHSILRVIQILGTLGNWRRVLQVIEWLETRERFKSYKSRYIYTTALDVLGKAKRPVEALNVFHAMRKGMSSYPDLAAYHCIAVTLGQAGYVKELFDVIDCMRSPPPTKFSTGYIEKWDPRLEPDIIIYNAVLNGCARRKQWEGAFWVLQQLKEQGLQPSSTTYGLVMEVMLACEKYNLVYEFFKKVQKSTIPNTLNYKVLVNTLWKEGKTDDAVFAVKDMERRGIVGSASLYYDLARCLCSAGRCQEALMQMDNICKVARKPLVVTYTGLMQACLDAGNVQDGTYIFKQMQAFCSPNLVTFNIMLKAYLEHGLFEDAKDLFQKMLDESCHVTRRSDYKNIVTPDSYTFNTMLEACAAEQKWDDFRYIFQEMLHRGYNFNTRRHLRMILDACRAGKGELLETTWKHLVHANRVPPPPLIKEMFCMKLEKNDYTAAITSITSHPTNDLQLHAFSEKGWLDLLQANTDRLQKDTIINLTHKLNVTVAGSDRPHPILQNLIYSCREFMESHVGGEINCEEKRKSFCIIDVKSE